MSSIRVRFAPSPTGSLHIGGARTALFNWLFARRNNGALILRIDDTDTERSTVISYREILNALEWLGLDWDEGPEKGGAYGPYFQSQRMDYYREAGTRLLSEGKAYLCYCTPEELTLRRRQAQAEGRPPMYDRCCRHLTSHEQALLQNEGRQPVIRLAIPDGITTVEDIVRGSVSFENTTIDDFVLFKSNGMPTYNFASVIDDHFMQISHVIRAEEHLSNTPKQILVFQALNYELPVFAHVPMILAPDRSKLSKRHGATSVEEYREQGYLPEAIINYLALLGWSPEGEEEIIPLEEIINRFSLERVSKNAAIYDTKKLTWMNGHYLREGDLDRITQMAIPFLQDKGLVSSQKLTERDYLHIRAIVGTVRDRVKTLDEVADAASYFFSDVSEYEEKGVRKYFSKVETIPILEKAKQALEVLPEFNAKTTEEAYRLVAEELDISTGHLFHPTRLAVSGRTMGPGLFDILELLGRETVLERLEKAIKWIKNHTA